LLSVRSSSEEVADHAPVTALAHGYRPPGVFCRRFKVVADSPADGVWINRYGYLSDDKLESVGRPWM
jgi:hypothetical protein